MGFMALNVQDKWLAPTTRGHFEWRTDTWGVILTEVIYDPAQRSERLRVPWAVIDAMRETR